ncbi:MAG: isocitrate dehydrogenase [Chloroflexi bacterium]|jgi:isocitrate/isopropylmalate dehydrogenase|nr:isocitrate dehydrogenase [Chloroflexota bacterium]
MRTVVVLEGDQTGQELLEESLRALDANVTGVPLHFERFDLSLEARRRTANGVTRDAATAMRTAGLGIKAATITPETKGDVGSPNAIVRELIDGSVILRVGRRLPGVRPVGGASAPIAVVRMATGDAYNAREARQGEPGSLDEVATREDRITRRTCRAVAEFSFLYAARHGATVYGGPKWTVSPVYEGMLKEEMDRAAAQNAAVPYQPDLIDAVYAHLVNLHGEPLVIPALNRDGDCLSDLVMQMFGTIASAESMLFSLDAGGNVAVAMAEAPHGTAPKLEGRNVANPLAMLLAAASVLDHVGTSDATRAATAMREACLGAIRDGIRTADLGGYSRTDEFTDEVIARTRAALSA